VEPGGVSAVLKLGLIKTSFPLTGLIFSICKEVFTPFFLLSVFTKATRLVLLGMAIPPSIPKNRAPPDTPAALKKSLRLTFFIA
jgi:hypothetical protein